MASQGPFYPTIVSTEVGPSGDNDWIGPTEVASNDGIEAQITAATYDANDHSYRLKATNFGFSIPAGATIDGILVEIEQRRFAGAAEDQEVRLYNAAGTLVGDDKQTATAWPGTATIASYGGSTDTWNAGLTDTDINDPDFGVAHIVLATAANTDIGVDFIRVTVFYTAAPASPTRGRVSFAELETPFVATRGRVSFAEFEAPLAPTRGRFSWAELEAPLAPTRGRTSWAELEVPNAPATPTRGRVSWGELEVPDPPTPTRGRVSFTEFETPALATRGRISWVELEAPEVGSGDYGWTQCWPSAVASFIQQQTRNG